MSRHQTEMDLACLKLAQAMASGHASKDAKNPRTVTIEHKGKTLLVKRTLKA